MLFHAFSCTPSYEYHSPARVSGFAGGRYCMGVCVYGCMGQKIFFNGIFRDLQEFIRELGEKIR